MTSTSKAKPLLLAFTLLEVMIALTLFAIISTIIAIAFKNMLYTNQKTNQENLSFQKIEIAQTLIRNDLSQIVDRPVSDLSGNTLPSVLLLHQELDFTRGGVDFFNSNHTSDLQRVNYIYKAGHLYRYSWPVLDPALGTTPKKMDLLDHVQRVSFQVYDDQNNLQIAWPIAVNSTLATNAQISSHLPNAIKVTIFFDAGTQLSDILMIPSRGLLNNNEL